MVKIGNYNTLRIVKILTFGLYLDGGSSGEILLPIRYAPDDCAVGDEVEVFIYFDSEDRIIATTEVPRIMVGEFALLRAVAITRVGAFVDWGLPKDLLVPFREQKAAMQVGGEYVVYCYIDDETQRIVASAKVEKFLNNTYPDYEVGEEVDLMIIGETDLGFSAIVNGLHTGVIYRNEVFQPLRRGDMLRGYIKLVRDDDKIDLVLHKPGYAKVDEVAQGILRILEDNGGYLAVTDSSHPDHIYDLFHISKKTFKKAIGALYRERFIAIEEQGIRLL